MILFNKNFFFLSLCHELGNRRHSPLPTASYVRSDDTLALVTSVSLPDRKVSPRKSIHTGLDIYPNSECNSYDTRELPASVIKRANVTNMVEVRPSAGVLTSGTPEAAA